ncbi:MAG: sacsin N-terminal ATP-binding-like domain-containing protein, partial [Vulcanisaeta sp.]
SDVEEVMRVRLQMLGNADVRNMINGILDLLRYHVFIEPTQFILELLQNAEDTCAKTFKVEINEGKIIIEHDGAPFTKDDIKSISSIALSSKKPELGHKGYLGIGFKSVFQVANRVDIYSRPKDRAKPSLAFTFCEYCWEDKVDVLRKYGLSIDDIKGGGWMVTPLSIEPVADIKGESTTRFIIHLRDARIVNDIVRMLIEEIKPTIFMFLTNIKEVMVRYKDGVRILRWGILRAFERNGITVMRVWASDEIDGRPTNYVFQVFKREVDVPKEVREDEITRKAQRNNVNKREVAIAFQVNEVKSSLVPVETNLQFLYSFLPLTEVRTGLKFLIHGDFIVQAGRRTLNPEARWNEWMMREIADLLNEAVDYLAEEYTGSYLDVIKHEHHILEPAMSRLLMPIYEVLSNKLRNPIVKCISCGRLAHVNETVALTSCVEEFVRSYGSFEELEKRISKHIISSEDDKRLRQHGINNVKSIRCEDLVNINYVSTDDLPKLYRIAYKSREGFERVAVKVKVLDGSIKAASEVWYVPNKLRSIVEVLRDEVPSVFEKIKGSLIHDDFVNRLGNSDDERVEVLKWLGVKEFTCNNTLNKDLLLAIKDISLEALIRYITLVYKNCGTEVPEENRFVVSSRGELLRARETHYSELPPEVVNLLNDQRLGKYIREYLGQLKIIHEDLRRGLGDELLEKLGVRRIEYCDIINELFNKVLLTRGGAPDPDEVIALTALVMKNYDKCPGLSRGDIWVLAMDGSVRKSSEV